MSPLTATSHALNPLRSPLRADKLWRMVAVIPAGAESDAKAMHSDLDKGIANNLDAASSKIN